LGGAIFNHQGTLTIENSTVTANTASGGTGATDGLGLGGAIFNLNGQATLDSATIALNTASQGGAVYDLGYLAADSAFTYVARVQLTNSILSNSIGGADAVATRPSAVSNGAANTVAAEVDASSGHDLVMSQTSTPVGLIVGAPLTADPQLGPLAVNAPGLTPTMALSLVSPAVDTGQTTLTTDQRGVSRPQGSADDIGAYELVQAPTYRPDAQIKLAGDASYLGVRVFDTTGAGQTRTTNTASGKSATFDVRFVNAGTHSDSIAIHGCKSSSGFAVKYFKGTTNVTASVTAGTYRTATLAVGASQVLALKIAVSPTAIAGKLDTCAVTASSHAAPTKQDVVKARVKAG
jgi:hypothetical protein